ncbi:succinate--CoA ligase subunit alpha [Alloscardovia theropitheci]|uniref:Succinate--CoA ligase subunit alpha n=1 Tax=Alloscardovia theropitheci TaxID=2496842 RepID=A0A4R0QR08_9BIFI|nr:succinate--CoA ligase subunit alpha [Alloscardovia theropitheci]TCD54782.1 succinate--CoA ligase subunit alpha [Alloscardovia theropitheci]
MSFINPNAPVIVQGMTGHQGMTHTARMLKAGTNIVGGVNPRKGGQTLTFDDIPDADGLGTKSREVPIYATCSQAKEATNAQASVIFVPPRFAKSAMVEAIEARIPLIVVITEGIPVADTAYCVALAQKQGIRIVGPNCPGLCTYTSHDEQNSGIRGVNLGIIPDDIVGYGSLGLVSKSGTLTYQLMSELSDYGFAAAIGVGGDPIVGTTQQEALEILNDDPRVKACVIIGEIGGSAEQELALWAKDHMTKPVVAYIAGYSAPEGKQMGHAGAIVSGGSGTAQGKKEALEKCGIKVGRNPSETAQLMREIMETL